jgi:hypothetical protein
MNDNCSNSLRERWASKIAVRFVAIHFLIGLVIAGWIYLSIPLTKYRIEQLALTPVPAARILIVNSDLIVNYWYLFAMLVPIVLMMDFRMLRWTGNWIGLRRTIHYGYLITLGLLVSVIVGQVLLS